MTSKNISGRFGKTVRAHRFKAQLTQEDVAESAGLHPTYVGMVERGVRNPTLDAASRMAKALKLPLWELVKESEIGGRSPKGTKH